MLRSDAVEFFSGPGYRLKGQFHRPETASQPLPAVVLCNGYMGLKEIYMPEVAAKLAEAGLASFAFDYRGFGESEGPRYRLVPNEQIEDIFNAVSYVESRRDVDPKRIAVWGTSLGGSHALAAAATDQRIGCVVANMPGMHFADHVLKRPDSARKSFLANLSADRHERVKTGISRGVSPLEVLPYDDDSRRAYEASLSKYPSRREMKFPLETADRLSAYMPDRLIDLIAPRPLMIMSAELDELTPPEDQRKLFDLAGLPKRFEVIRGATHYSAYMSPFFEQAIDLSVGFYRKTLTS